MSKLASRVAPKYPKTIVPSVIAIENANSKRKRRRVIGRGAALGGARALTSAGLSDDAGSSSCAGGTS